MPVVANNMPNTELVDKLRTITRAWRSWFAGKDAGGLAVTVDLASSEVTGVLPVTHGGTNRATLTAHDVLVGNGASSVGLVSPSTAGLVLTSNGVALDPTFQAPATAGTVTHTGTLTANELIVGNGGADIKATAATNGQVPIGKTSDGSVTLATLTQGSGVTITNGAGSITIAATGTGGTVTHTAGNLTLNQLAYGNGTADLKVTAATNGQIPIGKTSDGTAALATLTAGSGISVTNAANSITIAATGSAPGNLIGLVVYAQGTDTTLHTQSSNTLTDMDATNVLVTFTAPASGNVLIKCSVLHDQSSSVSGDCYWGLRESTTTIQEVFATNPTTGGFAFRFNLTFYVTGLSPSSSHTYKLAERVVAGTVHAFTGPAFGAAIMEVYAV